MSRTIRLAVLGLIATLLAVPVISALSNWHFSRSATQVAVLKAFYPQSQCDRANFKALELDDALYDYRYLFEISGSIECYKSLQKAAAVLRYDRGEVNSALADESWLVAPKAQLSDATMALKFLPDEKTILWLRDKT